jgi:hypothetical protein
MDDTSNNIRNASRKALGGAADSEAMKFVGDVLNSGAEMFAPVGGVAGLVGKGAKAAKAAVAADKVADGLKAADKVADAAKAIDKAADAVNASKKIKGAAEAGKAVAEQLGLDAAKASTESLGFFAKKLQSIKDAGGKVTPDIAKKAYEETVGAYGKAMEALNNLGAGKILSLKDKAPKLYDLLITNRVNGSLLNPLNYPHKAANAVLNNPLKSSAAFGVANAMNNQQKRDDARAEIEKLIAAEAAAEAVSSDTADSLTDEQIAEISKALGIN